MSFKTRGFALADWQDTAVRAWLDDSTGRPGTGTLEIVTGGGKTLIALSCAAELAATNPDLKVAVVVPTQALAHQWVDAIGRYTTIPSHEVGVLGAGRRDNLTDRTVLVAVLNSAAKHLPDIASEHQPLLLIVDEAHRAGAPKYSKVLNTPAPFRLGLSATPDREEVGEDGEPLAFDEQLVGQSLGDVVFRFGLREARLSGWLPDYTVNHHAVSLTPSERTRYDSLSRQVDDAQDSLRGLGGDPSRARSLARREDDLGVAARRWVAVTSQRKDLLYRAPERHRVAASLVADAFASAPPGRQPRVILFHERVDEAAHLREELSRLLPEVSVALEHSGLRANARRAALKGFADGTSPVLVSVKSLIEGIDVPAADTGISVASTASARQRIQSLGRVLRRSADGSSKHATMHLIYVDDTVDDLIYAKADWSDLTGEDANRYFKWPADAAAPEPLPGPPRTPLPTEEDAWASLRDTLLPAVWPGVVEGQEYSVDTTGVVHNQFGRLIANPQGVGDLLADFRRSPGGRFRVTPTHRLIIVWDVTTGTPTPWVLGQLAPFTTAPEVTSAATDASELHAGDPYSGPSDKKNGTFRISQRSGGTIERAVKGGRESALAEGPTPEAENARRTIAAWDDTGRPTTRFFVNTQDHAWFESGGGRRFLAHVPGGYSWPDD